MKLILNNFLCYENKEIEIPDSGVVLISGVSGIGKTSILKAIYFALYGTGTKIITHGKTKCKVELYIGTLHIIRMKGPNRLQVNDYEDDAAQDIINGTYGKNFDVTSYIQQNSLNSFINLSPSDKLEFLETFTFKDIDLQQIKRRAKQYIKDSNDELVSIQSKIETINDIFNTLPKIEKIKYPLKIQKQYVNDTEYKEKLLNIELNKNEILEEEIKVLNDNIKILEINLNKIKLKKVKNNNTIENIEKIEKKILNYKNELGILENEKIEDINIYEKLLQTILNNKTFIEYKKRYDEECKELENLIYMETEKINNDIKILKERIWKEYKQEECEETIEDYTNILYDIKLYEKLISEKNKIEIEYNIVEYKENIDKLKNKLIEDSKIYEDIQFQKNIYKCPTCNSSLKLENKLLINIENRKEYDDKDEKELYINMEKIKKDIKEKEKIYEKIYEKQSKYNNYEKQIREIVNKYENIDFYEEYKECENDLNYIKNYMNICIKDEKKLKQLEENLKNKTYSNTIITLQNKILDKKMKLDKMDYININIDYTEEEIRNKITYIRELNNKKETITKQINIYMNELDIYNKQLEHDNLEEIQNNIENELEDINNKLIGKVEEHKIVKKNSEIILKYKDDKKKYTEYNEWKNKLNILKQEEKKAEKKYSASGKLYEKITESESIAIANIINSINVHAQTYLDLFFEENPISVQLTPFKELKKKNTLTKPQINIIVDYKGMELDIHSLSGGEYARIVLAYTLALAEIFNSSFIMLDESLSSLNSDLGNKIIEIIKDQCSNKLVLIVSHQVFTSVFDHVIELN